MKQPIDILFRHWKTWADATNHVNATRQDLKETALPEVVIPAMEEWAGQVNQEALRLLRDLADLQNGPPLERYREEWERTMKEVYAFLEKYECNHDY